MSAMTTEEGRVPGGRAAAWRRTAGLVFPLSWRSLRRRKAGAALTALSLALGVATFLLFGGYFAATRRAVEGRIKPLALPADLVVMVGWTAGAGGMGAAGASGGSGGAAAGQASMAQALDRLPDVKEVTGLVTGTAYTSVGQRRVAGLGQSSLSALKLVAGNLPKVGGGSGATAGEALLPRSLAGSAGIAVGGEVTIATNAGGSWREGKFRVSGFFEGDSLFEGPVARREALVPLGFGPGDNAALVSVHPGSDRMGVARQVRGLFQGEATVLTPEYPAGLAGSWLSQALSPGNVAVFMVFAFSGLGVMNVLLLSFLQRKRQMGVFKALGMDDRDLRQLFFGEGLYVAAAGAVLGVLLTAILSAVLGQLTGTPFLISGWLVTWAMVLSFVVFALAAWLPAVLCQRASVTVLLQNKRIYLDPKTSCAECGRCGGF